MHRPTLSFVALTILTAVTSSSANAQPLGFGVAPRALCVTDPYGTPYCHWYGSPMAFNSYFNYSPNGTNSFSYSFTNTGYYWSGVPAVASATTPEWTVQRTSVLPISPYSSWGPYAPYSSPWVTRFGQTSGFNNEARALNRPTSAASPTVSLIQPVSAVNESASGSELSSVAAGDRLLREGRFAEAYLRYLKSERVTDNTQALSIREAFALVLMKRHSHAVAKLKRGLASESEPLDPAFELEQVLGAAYRIHLATAIESTEQWLKASPKDPDRILLATFLNDLDADLQASATD